MVDLAADKKYAIPAIAGTEFTTDLNNNIFRCYNNVVEKISVSVGPSTNITDSTMNQTINSTVNSTTNSTVNSTTNSTVNSTTNSTVNSTNSTVNSTNSTVNSTNSTINSTNSTLHSQTIPVQDNFYIALDGDPTQKAALGFIQ